MHFVDQTLDDLLHEVLQALLEKPFEIVASRGRTAELIGVTLTLTNPRARLSRTETKGKLFSALGELLWYLRGSDALEVIVRYISKYAEDAEEDGTLYGAYGPRLLSMRGNNQIANVIGLLKNRPTSRQAVIQLFNAEDIASPHKEIPCTCLLQYLLRDGKLIALTTMRSNDAYLGLPHDVFCFTMIQEIVARAIGVDVGAYIHFVGSLHLYEPNKEDARAFIDEGYQSRIQMPEMPKGDPMILITKLLSIEEGFRIGKPGVICDVPDPYWNDIAHLLGIFVAPNNDRAKEMARGLSSNVYDIFIQDRLDRKDRRG
jgi:thymidylate synthase